jgi:hypothetical protein
VFDEQFDEIDLPARARFLEEMLEMRFYGRFRIGAVSYRPDKFGADHQSIGVVKQRGQCARKDKQHEHAEQDQRAALRRR